MKTTQFVSELEKDFEKWKSEIQRLTKEVEELKKPLTDDERMELGILKGHRNNPTRWMSQEEHDRLSVLVNKEWGNVHPELTRLRELLTIVKPYISELYDYPAFPKDEIKQLVAKIDNVLNHKP